MRLTKILHPEIITDRRGPVTLRKIYRQALSQIEFVAETGGVIVPTLVLESDPVNQRAMTLMRRWQLDNGKVYHVSKDFLLALAGVERGVSLDYLPQRFVGYVSFADRTIYDDTHEVEGAYVYLGPARYAGLKDVSEKRVLWVVYICSGGAVIASVSIPLKQGETIEDLMRTVCLECEGSIPILNKRKNALVYNTVVNVVMYLHSQEPNVQRLPAVHEISNRKASELALKTGLRNECTVPVTFVNWNYAGQRVYTAEKTWVETFPRWQPCGVGLAQVKLIWVRAHERVYGNK